jgi:hypothetical protein
MVGSSGKKTRYGYSLVSCPGMEKVLWKSCPVRNEKRCSGKGVARNE